MMQINASVVTNTVASAFILSFAGAATLGSDSPTPSSIPSPLQVIAPPLGNAITALSLDHDAYAQMRRLQAFDIADFPLNGDRRVDLRVRRFDVFSTDAQVVLGSGEGDRPLARPDVTLLSGEVVGVPGSMVFLGLSPHGTHGYIQFPDEMFIISTRAGNTIIYSLTSLPEGLLTLPDFQCDVIEVVDRIGADVGRDQTANGASVQCRVVDIAVETDWEFTQIFDGDTEASSAYATILIGAASEIYSRDVFTTLKIVFLRVWAENNDPWTINGGFGQFVDFWNANMQDVDRHVAHFLSGHPGGGIAYLPGVCQEGLDYGYSSGMNGYFPYPLEHNNNQNWDIIVVCHELGHNFGSPHTHDYDPPIDECAFGRCENAENGTLMSYCHTCPGGLANFRLEFHPIVIETMLNYLANDAPCDTLAHPADLDCDGSVGASDLLILLASWGACADCQECPADLSDDCTVGAADLLILLANWG